MPQTPDNVPPIPEYSRLLDGRVAAVTGGGRDGIGGAIAELFLQHGATVEIAEIDPARADVPGAHATVLDVRDVDAVNTWAADVVARNGRVDILVNNVGDYRQLVRFEQYEPDHWGDMFDINLRHFFTVTRAFLPVMTEQHHGVIVNVHSVEGLRGYPGEPVYGAFKAAVAKFTTDMAVRFGRHGIRVNGIGPDLTQTPQVDYLTSYEDLDHLWTSWAPVGRLGWPEDQARVALFLASDLSSFVTGHNIPVDGGTKACGGWFFSPNERRFVNRPRGL
jgi:NAD(P)-dependent dehydrogenase (short-subunit alcohol dehydrogenase family)